MGDIPLGVWEPDFPGLPLPPESCPSTFLRDFPPSNEFLCLNFSNQRGLFTLTWQSEVPTVVAKNLALSRMISSLKGKPWCCRFFAQFDKARSISGNLPFDRFIGDRLPSSGYRYFSFCRRTLETVLWPMST